MLADGLPSSRDWIALASTTLELLGVIIVVVGVAFATLGFLRGMTRTSNPALPRDTGLGERMRGGVGRALLLGLEVLVAADIVQTVALDLTIEHIATLGLLVVVRTFLSWSIILELENRWPWQHPTNTERSDAGRTTPTLG